MSMILNPYRHAAAGGGTTFGNASRDFEMGSSQYVDLGTACDIGTSDASLAIWVKAESNSGSMALFGGAVFRNENAISLAQISTGGISAYFRTISGGLKGTSPSALSLGNWVHYAATYDRDGLMTFYVNGSSFATTSISADSALNVTATTYSSRISGAGLAWFWDGLAADARLYDRVLSGSEVSDLASGTDVSSGLTGWWLTDNDDVLDYAGSNDGTNSGTTYSTDGPFD